MSEKITKEAIEETAGEPEVIDGRCSVCGNEMRVTGSKYVLEDDKTPDVETRLYTVLSMECGNPQCPQYGMETTVKNELPLV